MTKLGSLLCSSVAQKFVMGLTGLFLVVFLILHLAGNLLLYFSSPGPFNEYAFRIDSMGHLKTIGEIGLLLLFGTHIVQALAVKVQNKSARPEAYAMARTKGGPSKANMSSTTMIFSGLLMLVFLIVHIKGFRFGPSIEEGYVTEVAGGAARDLHRLVVESFKDPLIAGFYIFAMLVMGTHVRHGFWSAFQSLGVNRPGISKILYVAGVFLAILLAVGFLGIPVYLYLQG